MSAHINPEQPRPACPSELEGALVRLLGARWVRTAPRDLLSYSYDGTGEKYLPQVVVFPASTEDVSECVSMARRFGFPVIARGAATNLSGGTLPIHGGMVINLLRMDRVLSIDSEARLAVVEAGVVNEAVQQAAGPYGLFYAPDPSSMKVATLGGSLAENAGGPRCAKYGVTINHVIGLTVVLADGSVVELGGAVEDMPGLDLVPVMVGSEGTLGVITQAVLRLTPLPAAYRTMMGVFPGVSAVAAAVSAVVAAGILPAGMEMIDRATLDLINQSTGGSFPSDAEAVLLAEVDGEPDEIRPQAERMERLMREHGALDVIVAHTEAERESLWAARRAGYGALARSSRSLSSMDVTVPRDRLVVMIDEVLRLAGEFSLKLFLVAHAGDGNMHPAVPFDPNDVSQCERLAGLMDAVARAAVALGGSISGEHGVGIEKLAEMEVQYSPDQLDLMRAVRRVFDPSLTMNPGKNVPAPAGGW